MTTRDYKNRATTDTTLFQLLHTKIIRAWDWLGPFCQDFLQGAAIAALLLLAWALWPHERHVAPDTEVLSADQWSCTRAQPSGLHAACTAYERK